MLATKLQFLYVYSKIVYVCVRKSVLITTPKTQT
jgi:hypothetical protein